MKTEDSIEEQTKLFEGKDHWHLDTKKDVVFSDGPNGLRIEDALGIGFNHSKEATAFPTEALMGCCFDTNLLYRYGEMLAEECIQENVDVILGPGVNTKRSPLCGRSFEYFSEDPVLSGEYASAYINGVQSKKIGTSLKHFAANSRELGRQVQDSIVDERTLQELYLRQFKITIEKSHPWTLMAAYNRLNGTYCCENAKLFQEARSWGFDGVMLSDWGGVSDPVRSIQNGLNIEMPGYNGTARVLVKAVQEGKLSADCVKESSTYVKKLVEKCGQYESCTYDKAVHDRFCEEAAEESIVLLKNKNALPLAKEEKIAVIGPFAMHPCIQGGGSSQVNARKHDNLLQALKQDDISFSYAEGYSLKNEEIDEALQDEAVEAAQGKDKVIVFVGELPGSSGEGFDRASMELPFNQNTLIRNLVHAGAHVIVVLQTGAPVTMPWRDMVDGIIAEYQAGAASGIALKKILYGEVNPSGHLAESWPRRQEDVPAARYYNGEVLQTQYREGIFVGYRFYDTFDIPVAYPFGYGLSYTNYQYSDLQVSAENGCVHVSLKVKNIGDMDGRAVVQIYAGMKNSQIARPLKELKSFASVDLKTQEEKEVQADFDQSLLAYYDVKKMTWLIEKGTYTILAGTSVNEMILQKDIEIEGTTEPYSTLDKSFLQFEEGMVYVADQDYTKMLGYEIPEIPAPRPFTQDTTIRDLRASRLGRFINFCVRRVLHTNTFNGVDDTSVYNAPIRQMLWLKDHYTWNTVDAVVKYLNHHGVKELHGIRKSLKKKNSH